MCFIGFCFICFQKECFSLSRLLFLTHTYTHTLSHTHSHTNRVTETHTYTSYSHTSHTYAGNHRHTHTSRHKDQHTHLYFVLRAGGCSPVPEDLEPDRWCHKGLGQLQCILGQLQCILGQLQCILGPPVAQADERSFGLHYSPVPPRRTGKIILHVLLLSVSL